MKTKEEIDKFLKGWEKALVKGLDELGYEVFIDKKGNECLRKDYVDITDRNTVQAMYNKVGDYLVETKQFILK